MCAMKRRSFARYGLESFMPVVFVLQEVAEAFVFECAGEVEEVFIAAAGKGGDNNGIFWHSRRNLLHMRERVRAFERGNNTLHAGEVVGRSDGLRIERVDEFHAFLLVQLRKLRAEARIIEPCRYRVRRRYLAVLGLQEERFVSLKDAKLAGNPARGVFAHILPRAAGLDADELHTCVGDKVIETAYRITAAAHARDNCIW